MTIFKRQPGSLFIWVFAVLHVLVCGCTSGSNVSAKLPVNVFKEESNLLLTNDNGKRTKTTSNAAEIDAAMYHRLLLHLVHGKPTARWPVNTDFPLAGALIPFKRIVAYYGNFYTPNMGVLGVTPPDSMLARLMTEVKKWQLADTTIPVLPALHYVVVTAQAHPGADHKYRARMPAAEIDKALRLAQKINGIVFLDVQVGWSSVNNELPWLEKYFSMPGVHLGIDPEYSMKTRKVPCTEIGTFDAADINAASAYLAEIVKKYNLPPKILVVHRFTRQMVTNYKKIIIRPEVQIVMDMDGFGYPAKKIDSYVGAIQQEPVQFTGFKLFYKYDRLSAPYRLMTEGEILNLYPAPIYIQYQ